MTMDRSSTIQANAELHQTLLSSLSELGYVPDALAAKAAELDAERGVLRTAKEDCTRLDEEQKQAYAALTSLKTPRRRLSFKFRHPLSADDALLAENQSAERRYEAAFAEGQLMLGRVRELEASIERMQDEQADLAQLEARRVELEGEVSLLYERVFAGPTPGHPDEDEAESVLVALGMQVDELKTNVARDRAVLELYRQLLPAAEHAERQFHKAAHARPDGRGGSSQWHHKEKSKRLYHEARGIEKRILKMHGHIVVFHESLPSGDWAREQHCARMRAYFRACRDKVALVLARLEVELQSAEAEEGSARAELRELRCLIMQDAVAPPRYAKPGKGFNWVQPGE